MLLRLVLETGAILAIAVRALPLWVGLGSWSNIDGFVAVFANRDGAAIRARYHHDCIAVAMWTRQFHRNLPLFAVSTGRLVLVGSTPEPRCCSRLDCRT